MRFEWYIIGIMRNVEVIVALFAVKEGTMIFLVGLYEL